MKRKVLIGTVCAAVLLGGSIAVVSAKDDGETASKKDMIAIDKAKATALQEVNGEVESIDLETKMGKPYYEVEIEKDQMDYDIYIDATTGETYSVRQDDRFDDDFDDGYDDVGIETGSKTTDQAISESEAIQIAEKAVNGKMVEIELEHDDGVLKYELELRTDRGEAEVDINARTGEVIEIEYDDED